MTTSITISLTAVIKEILAQSALRHVLRNDVPGLLCRDQEPALRKLLDGVLARIILQLGIDSYDDMPPDSDLFHFEIPAVLSNASLFRALIEQAAANHVLATAYASADPAASAHFTRMGEASEKVASQMLAAAVPAFIIPHSL